MEYKVLTESDSKWLGKFDPESLERVLNEYADEGWRLVGSLLASSVWKSFKSEIVVVLERDRPAA